MEQVQAMAAERDEARTEASRLREEGGSYKEDLQEKQEAIAAVIRSEMQSWELELTLLGMTWDDLGEVGRGYFLGRLEDVWKVSVWGAGGLGKWDGMAAAAASAVVRARDLQGPRENVSENA